MTFLSQSREQTIGTLISERCFKRTYPKYTEIGCPGSKGNKLHFLNYWLKVKAETEPGFATVY